MDDGELLTRIQAGDESAYDTAFRAWYPILVRVAGSLVRDTDAAEEVAQDVMVELWRRRHVIDASVSLRAYLLRSVRNRSLNQLRHLRVRRQSEAEIEATYDAPLASDQPIVAKELSEAVQIALKELPPRCREVFELSRVSGLKYTEIAETLGISPKTVEAQMGKALRILRERLSEWIVPPNLRTKSVSTDEH
ncbi:MAG TPA: RNA polymerase sigma-70 factor [Gemmatimonadaceae bacterium]|nr:RNA polymerase sigma-70 factor [Gemmatimonadaceae bacterium]